MGGDHVDSGEDWLHGRDAARLAPRGGEPTSGASGVVAQDRDRLKLLEREVKELRRANEILRKASAYFAQAELDRREKW
jgi:transposase-like protein